VEFMGVADTGDRRSVRGMTWHLDIVKGSESASRKANRAWAASPPPGTTAQ
jgi:hypothetical protein